MTIFRIMFKKTILVLVFSLMTPIFVHANSSVDAQNLKNIEVILNQINLLQLKVQNLLDVSKVGTNASSTFRVLKNGMRGQDVESLQKILSKDREIYPEGLVTAFFGPATQRAVIRFQEKNGLEKTGQVNLITHNFLQKKIESSSTQKISSNRENENKGNTISVIITSTKDRIIKGESVTISWSSKNATNCSAVENWGANGISGSLNLVPEKTRVYSIRCSGIEGVSEKFVSVQVDEPSKKIVPTPRYLTVTMSENCGGRIRLSWEKVAGTSSYQLQRQPRPAIIQVNNTEFVDEGLVPGVTYGYNVRALDSSLEVVSEWSTSVSGIASPACSTNPGAGSTGRPIAQP